MAAVPVAAAAAAVLVPVEGCPLQAEAHVRPAELLVRPVEVFGPAGAAKPQRAAEEQLVADNRVQPARVAGRQSPEPEARVVDRLQPGPVVLAGRKPEPAQAVDRSPPALAVPPRAKAARRHSARVPAQERLPSRLATVQPPAK